jgi:trehalose/maltose transport system substrate-binding protein
MSRSLPIAAAMSCLLLVATPGTTVAAEVAISCGAVGLELQLCRSGAETWARDSGNRVKVVSTPNDSNERLALYHQLFANRSSDIDVFQIDEMQPMLPRGA